MLHVQEVRARRVRQEVEQTKHSRSNVGTPAVTDDAGPGGQLHDERDKVQERRNAGVQQLRQDPVDGQIQHLADPEQVHEAPEDGRDERGDHDEQEPVGSAEQGRRRARHADDAEQQLHQLQNTRNGLEVLEVKFNPVQTVIWFGLARRIGPRRRRRRVALVHRDNRFRHHG